MAWTTFSTGSESEGVSGSQPAWATTAGYGGRVVPIGKVRRKGIAMQPLMQPDPSEQSWIDRLVASPAVRSGYLSLAAHLVLCILLAFFALEKKPDRRQRPLLLSLGPQTPLDAGAVPLATVAIGTAEAVAAEAEAEAEAKAAAAAAATEFPTVDDVPLVRVPEPALPMAVAGADVPALSDPLSPLIAGPLVQPISIRGGQPGSGAGVTAGPRTAARKSHGADGPPAGQPFASRTGAARGESARSRGGNAASEAAVERGLDWLALHQAVDGSWRFDLSGCRCDGACHDPGTLTSSTASTAIALLPFLGAGHTHIEGRHQQTVSRGIYYLMSRMQPTPRGGDFSEGTMYGHGVTTLVLAECLGMTKDDMLIGPVREGVRFIETAQDMHSGGWRYLPGQAGDITVTAWQVAALKSAQLAGVEPSSPTIEGVRRFLDSVQTQSGAAYGYRSPAAKPCTSTIGLLCRMYTGWGPEQEPLRRGITALAKPGPSPAAIYQNFYLSQALLQMDHPVWPRWNARNRDQIVGQQARFAHESGSWFFEDHDTAPGGRLAHTALAILTLEVYYRLLPIYQQEAVETEF